MALGRYAEAKEQFQLAIQFEPTFADNYIFLGQLEFYQGNQARGFELFEQAMKVEPGAARVHKAFALGHIMTGEVEVALKRMQASLGQSSINPQVLQETAHMAFSLNQPQVGQRIQQRAKENGVQLQ
jgi:tetratricopeptide (TPR) repeat protein